MAILIKPELRFPWESLSPTDKERLGVLERPIMWALQRDPEMRASMHDMKVLIENAFTEIECKPSSTEGCARPRSSRPPFLPATLCQERHAAAVPASDSAASNWLDTEAAAQFESAMAKCDAVLACEASKHRASSQVSKSRKSKHLASTDVPNSRGYTEAHAPSTMDDRTFLIPEMAPQSHRPADDFYNNFFADTQTLARYYCSSNIEYRALKRMIDSMRQVERARIDNQRRVPDRRPDLEMELMPITKHKPRDKGCVPLTPFPSQMGAASKQPSDVTQTVRNFQRGCTTGPPSWAEQPAFIAHAVSCIKPDAVPTSNGAGASTSNGAGASTSTGAC
jgi:hypothetical protein